MRVICFDLETSFVAKGHRKSTALRVFECGAVEIGGPGTFHALVDPWRGAEDLPAAIRAHGGNPEPTLRFMRKWARGCDWAPAPRRHESDADFVARLLRERASKFVDTAAFVGDFQAFLGEAADTYVLAHNGASHDFKALEGSLERYRLVDTLRLFRKVWPNEGSYAQPHLHKAKLGKPYRAHWAIDDATALAALVRAAHLDWQTRGHPGTLVELLDETRAEARRPRPSGWTAAASDLEDIRGVGPKTCEALRARGVLTKTDLLGLPADRLDAVLDGLRARVAIRAWLAASAPLTPSEAAPRTTCTCA